MFEKEGFGAQRGCSWPYGNFRKFGYLTFKVLIMRILLFRVLYWGFPIFGNSHMKEPYGMTLVAFEACILVVIIQSPQLPLYFPLYLERWSSLGLSILGFLGRFSRSQSIVHVSLHQLQQPSCLWTNHMKRITLDGPSWRIYIYTGSGELFRVFLHDRGYKACIRA